MVEFIKSWKFMAIIVAVLTVVVVVMLVYGITTHTEPGLMTETPGFSAQDTPIGVCTVLYTPDGPGSEEDLDNAITLTRDAVHTINQRIGVDVYEYLDAGTPGPCRVRVSVGNPSERGWRDGGGDAVFHAGDRECMVTTTNTGTNELLSLVIQHELGHCLGLDHDDFAMSIMFGGPGNALSPTPAGQFPPRITDSDRALLREFYLP